MPAAGPDMPRVAFKTLGCRLNQAETAALAASFEARGFVTVPYGEPCEVCVVHGCAITRQAERQSLRAVRSAALLPGQPFVVLAGCAADLKDHEGLREAGAGLLAGRADKPRLAELTAAALGLPPVPKIEVSPGLPRFEGRRAFIKVQDGCDFHCAYCIVPSLRGPPASRPLAAILREAEGAVAAGYRELVLAGANLGLWREGGLRLPQLLETMAALPGLGRLRLGSIEISTVERDVVAVMADQPKICAFLHLPLQSGDDRILAAMGRRYTAAQFRAAAEEAAARLPRLGLGTDIIAGFPGEDDAAFANTLRLLEDLPVSNIHAFPYSRRPGTRAADLPGAVPHAVKKARVAELLALKQKKREAFAASFIGREVQVLIEGKHAKETGTGWTAEYLEAQVAGMPPPGSLVTLRVREAKGTILLGG
jgi:threonylcarbamoyladenosine tRNA methylthiotransferase MtaB